eukprot:752363-Hanusia_phi.AAC.5
MVGQVKAVFCLRPDRRVVLARDAYEQSLAAQKLNSMPDAVKTRYEENATGVMSPPSIFLNYIPLALLCNKVTRAAFARTAR